MYAFGGFVVSCLMATSLFAKVPAPFMSVLQRDDTRGLALLLELTGFGINKAIDKHHGYAMLHLAAKHNKVKITQWLLDNDADVEIKSGWRKASPIIVAAAHGHVAAMAVLLHNKANIDARNKFNYTPLIEASRRNKYVAANWLIANGADVNANANVNANSDAHNDDWSALMWSLRSGKDSISEKLLRAEANVHATYGGYDAGHTALIMASAMGKVRMVSAMVEKGADVNARSEVLGTTPILLAVDGHSSFSNITGFGDHITDSDNYRQVIEILQNAGADIDAQNFFAKETGLFYAVRNGDGEMIKILAEAGANFAITNEDGEDIMSLATQLGEQQVIEAFIELGYMSVLPKPSRDSIVID